MIYILPGMGATGDMFSESDPRFIRTMCKAIFTWDGLGSGILPCRIHGSHHHIISIFDEFDVRIDGGHLIAMTHPVQCVRTIAEL